MGRRNHNIGVSHISLKMIHEQVVISDLILFEDFLARHKFSTVEIAYIKSLRADGLSLRSIIEKLDIRNL
ncbi:hypothetical protein LCGC14_0175030 [marine sediment metagenome]|uniref:Uncharacterized protein n=1 Tax=marine sediment metagenome TaxID=412755 RepID=A0A0F9UV66_9ZZZZ